MPHRNHNRRFRLNTTVLAFVVLVVFLVPGQAGFAEETTVISQEVVVDPGNQRDAPVTIPNDDDPPGDAGEHGISVAVEGGVTNPTEVPIQVVEPTAAPAVIDNGAPSNEVQVEPEAPTPNAVPTPSAAPVATEAAGGSGDTAGNADPVVKLESVSFSPVDPASPQAFTIGVVKLSWSGAPVSGDWSFTVTFDDFVSNRSGDRVPAANLTLIDGSVPQGISVSQEPGMGMFTLSFDASGSQSRDGEATVNVRLEIPNPDAGSTYLSRVTVVTLK